MREQPRLDHRAAAVELDELQHPLGERRAVQQHAERPADLAEHAQHVVDDRMKFGRHIILAGNGRYARHRLLLFGFRFRLIRSPGESRGPLFGARAGCKVGPGLRRDRGFCCDEIHPTW